MPTPVVIRARSGERDDNIDFGQLVGGDASAVVEGDCRTGSRGCALAADETAAFAAGNKHAGAGVVAVQR